MNIWRKGYVMRRYSQQKNRNGYATRGYTDTTVLLNVQTITETQTSTSADGKRSVKRIKSYGSFPFRVEDVRNGIQADRLFFAGAWFECESSVFWEHTPLSHYRSQFVRVSEAIDSSDTVPPTGSHTQEGGAVDET